MHSKFCFRTPLDNQRDNGSQTVSKSAKDHFFANFSSFWNRKSWETSLLVRSEFLGLFVNPFTADERYFGHNTGILPQPIQMHYLKDETLSLMTLLHF